MVERGDQPEAESGGAALCRACGGEEGPCLASTFPACFSLWRCLCVPWCPVTWFSLALVCFTLWKESSFSHLSLRVDWNHCIPNPPPPRYKIITGPSQQAGVAPWDNTVPADTSFLLVWALAVNHTRGTRMQERGCRRSGKARPQFWVFCLLQVLVLLADHLTSLLTAYRRRLRETGTCRGQWEAWSLV